MLIWTRFCKKVKIKLNIVINYIFVAPVTILFPFCNETVVVTVVEFEHSLHLKYLYVAQEVQINLYFSVEMYQSVIFT